MMSVTHDKTDHWNTITDLKAASDLNAADQVFSWRSSFVCFRVRGFAL